MELKSITFEIGGKEYTLPMKDAKELYDELQKIFGNTTMYVLPTPTPYYYPSNPWSPWTVTCSGNSNDTPKML